MVCALMLPGAHPPKIELPGLIDRGADMTVISLSLWLPVWPLTPMGQSIVRVGGPAHTLMSQRFVLISNVKGQGTSV